MQAKRKQVGMANATIVEDLSPIAATTILITNTRAVKMFPASSSINSPEYFVLSSVTIMSTFGGRISLVFSIISLICLATTTSRASVFFKTLTVDEFLPLTRA